MRIYEAENRVGERRVVLVCETVEEERILGQYPTLDAIVRCDTEHADGAREVEWCCRVENVTDDDCADWAEADL